MKKQTLVETGICGIKVELSITDQLEIREVLKSLLPLFNNLPVKEGTNTTHIMALMKKYATKEALPKDTYAQAIMDVAAFLDKLAYNPQKSNLFTPEEETEETY